MALESVFLVIVLGAPKFYARQDRGFDRAVLRTLYFFARSFDGFALSGVGIPDRGAVLRTGARERRLVPAPEEFEDMLPRDLLGGELDLECLCMICQIVIGRGVCTTAGIPDAGFVDSVDGPKLGVRSPESAQ